MGQDWSIADAAEALGGKLVTDHDALADECLRVLTEMQGRVAKDVCERYGFWRDTIDETVKAAREGGLTARVELYSYWFELKGQRVTPVFEYGFETHEGSLRWFHRARAQG